MIGHIESNRRLRRQMQTVNHAVQRLSNSDITVTEVHIGGATPRLNVVMPAQARPLPGTTYKRLRCEVGMREERTAHAWGCCIEWEVE